jgi:hypothetical protein
MIPEPPRSAKKRYLPRMIWYNITVRNLHEVNTGKLWYSITVRDLHK